MIKEDIFYFKLIALSIVYKSSINLETVQKHIFFDNNRILIKNEHNYSYPAELSEKSNHIKEDFLIIKVKINKKLTCNL